MWDDLMEEASLPVNNLMIVDGINLAIRWKSKGAKEFAAHFVSTINSLAKSYRARQIILLLDYKGSTFRKELLPTYKGARKERINNQTEEEKQAAMEFFAELDKGIELSKNVCHTIKLEGVEADDMAAFFVEEYEDKDDFDHIWMISTDADWDELLADNVSRFSYKTRREYTLENFWDEHGCDDPEQFTQIKAIKGDRSDSVPGVEGIGDKRAYNLVRQYGDVLDIIEQLPLPGKQKFIQDLNNSAELLLLNLALTDLRSNYLEAINAGGESHIAYLDNVIANINRGMTCSNQYNIN